MRLQLVCLTFRIKKERCGMWSPTLQECGVRYSYPARVVDLRTVPLGQGIVLTVHGVRDVTITSQNHSLVQFTWKQNGFFDTSKSGHPITTQATIVDRFLSSLTAHWVPGFTINPNKAGGSITFSVPSSVLLKFFFNSVLFKATARLLVCCISRYVNYRLTLAKCNLLDQLQQWKCSADPKKPFIVASRYKGEYVWAANDFITGEQLIFQEIKPTKPLNCRVDRASASETYARAPFPLWSNQKV